MVRLLDRWAKDSCELGIYSEERLGFTVRVRFLGKTFVEGGFKDPDEAQRRGIELLVAMSGQLECAA